MMSITTDAIGGDGTFDPRYTCDLDNSSPELRWENPPPETVGFAVIAEDRDVQAGIFTHWLIYDIPSTVRHLPAGIPPQEALPNGIRQGINSFGKLGYAGPCPPLGASVHQYCFRLLALKEIPTLQPRMKRENFLKAVETFILGEAEILGRYQRMIQKAG